MRKLLSFLLGVIIAISFVELLCTVTVNFYQKDHFAHRNDFAAHGKRIILTAGASHTYGVGASADHSYPAFLQQKLDANFPGQFLVKNIAVPAMNSSFVREKIEQELEKYTPFLVLLRTGEPNYWDSRGFEHISPMRSWFMQTAIYRLWKLFWYKRKSNVIAQKLDTCELAIDLEQAVALNKFNYSHKQLIEAQPFLQLWVKQFPRFYFTLGHIEKFYNHNEAQAEKFYQQGLSLLLQEFPSFTPSTVGTIGHYFNSLLKRNMSPSSLMEAFQNFNEGLISLLTNLDDLDNFQLAQINHYITHSLLLKKYTLSEIRHYSYYFSGFSERNRFFLALFQLFLDQNYVASYKILQQLLDKGIQGPTKELSLLLLDIIQKHFASPADAKKIRHKLKQYAHQQLPHIAIRQWIERDIEKIYQALHACKSQLVLLNYVPTLTAKNTLIPNDVNSILHSIAKKNNLLLVDNEGFLLHYLHPLTFAQRRSFYNVVDGQIDSHLNDRGYKLTSEHLYQFLIKYQLIY